MRRGLKPQGESLDGTVRGQEGRRDADQERADFEKLGDEMTPMKRHGTAQEVARAVLFLALDATFTTGARLAIDGGLSL